MGYSQPRRIEEYVAREIGLALAMLGVVLVQTVLLPRPWTIPINVVLMLVICRALLADPSSTARWAFYGGISLDICAGSVLGTHALALLAATLAAALPLGHMSRDNWMLPLLGVLLGAPVYHSVIGLTTMLVVAPVDLRSYVFVAMLPGTLMALIPALPLYLTIRWIKSRRRGEVPIDVY